MAFKFSTGLRIAQVFNSSLHEALTGCVIRLYSGPVPSGPDAKLEGNTLLLEITEDDGPLTFEPAGSEPTLTKNLSKIWQGDVMASGTATFFRVCAQSDAGAQSDTAVRIQGSVGGPSADLTISNAELVEGAPQRLEYFAISMTEFA